MLADAPLYIMRYSIRVGTVGGAIVSGQREVLEKAYHTTMLQKFSISQNGAYDGSSSSIQLHGATSSVASKYWRDFVQRVQDHPMALLQRV